MLTQERHANDLSRGHRFFLLVLVSIGSSIIYTPAYLQYVFEDPLGKALIASGAATADNGLFIIEGVGVVCGVGRVVAG